MIQYSDNPVARFSLIFDRAMANVFVTEFSTDSVRLSIFHHDGDYTARIEALPMVSLFAQNGYGPNITEAVIDAIKGLGINLMLMADELSETYS